MVPDYSPKPEIKFISSTIKECVLPGLGEECPPLTISHFINIVQCSFQSVSMHNIHLLIEMLALKMCYCKNQEDYGGNNLLINLQGRWNYMDASVYRSHKTVCFDDTNRICCNQKCEFLWSDQGRLIDNSWISIRGFECVRECLG